MANELLYDAATSQLMYHTSSGQLLYKINGLTGFTMYSTGAVESSGEDQSWQAEDFNNDPGTWETPVLTTDAAWATPGSGTSWISFPPDKNQLTTPNPWVINYRQQGVVFGVDIDAGTFDLELEVACDQRITEVYVNGVAQGIEVPPGGGDGFNPATTIHIDGDDFSVGSTNEIIFETEDDGAVQGFYCRVVSATW